MKVEVTARLGDEAQRLPIACGDGKRTFKWLAVAAGQQLAQMQPNGRLRVRDQLRLSSSRGLLHPKRVFSDKCSFLHPDALISDYLQPEEAVTVEFSTEMPVDACGIPVLEDWQKLAFVHSEEQAGAVEEVMAKLSAQLSAAEMGEHLENSRLQAAETRRAAHFMRQILRSQMIDEVKGFQQVEEDWEILSVVHGDMRADELEQVKQLTNKYLLCFQDMFARFAIDKQIPFDRTLSLLQSIGVFGSEQLPKQQLSSIFRATTEAIDAATAEGASQHAHLQSQGTSVPPSSPTATRPAGGLSRVGLLSFLIRLAAHRFIGTFDVEALEKLRHESDAQRISIPTYAQAFRMLVERHVMPYLEAARSECAVKAIVMDDETLALLRRFHDDLSAVFLRYCQRRGEAYSALRIQDVIVLFADSGLTPESQERPRARHHQHLATDPGSELHNWASELLRATRNPFNVGKLPQGRYSHDQDTDDSISYSEVLEMLVRVGLLQLKPTAGTDLERISAAAQKMAALATSHSSGK
jgi:hypothetical protein